MDSPWQVPLPLEKYTKSRVVVYFYSGGWIPIMFYPLVDAIKLHCKASSLGMDIVLFPPDLDPRSSYISLTEAHQAIAAQLRDTEALTDVTDEDFKYVKRRIGKTTGQRMKI